MREKINELSLSWRKRIILLALLLFVGVAGSLLFLRFGNARSGAFLYARCRRTEGVHAARFCQRLGRKLPEIEEYARLWRAMAMMPDMEAVGMLKDIVAYRPQSPAAREAHIALARYYADQEALQAEEAYRAALELYDTVALRRELAHYLEEIGDNEGAYAEYRRILGEQYDAFADMRRTGPAPVVVAKDLNAAYYYRDAVETLRGIDALEAFSVRAQALKGLGRYDEAVENYRDWLERAPDDEEALGGLLEALRELGREDEAAALLEAQEEEGVPDTPEPTVEEEGDKREALDPLASQLNSPYPVSWWSATTTLEKEGRITETLPIYARVARADTYLADDAAYRLYVLARRLEDEETQAEAERLLEEQGLNWLGLRASDRQSQLPITPPLDAGGMGVVAKAEALESIGRHDLAYLELLLAARFRRRPESDLAMAQALFARGYVVEAQSIAAQFIDERGKAPLAFWRLSYPRPYSGTVTAEAATFDVDPLLIWAIMRQESRFDARARGYAGERGLMQIMPTTQEWIANALEEAISPGEAYTPPKNVRMSAWFLRWLLEYYDGDAELALLAYNGGASNVDRWLEDPLVSERDDLLRWIGFGSTREYLEKVGLNYQIYKILYGDEEAEGRKWESHGKKRVGDTQHPNACFSEESG
ncbi:MAG: transglycosylase SLT domain-containing protein [Chloroflexota bacterium]|nr:transglycosylase SLT domain-containing protein [Chloroflexota bacterium]